MQFGCAIAARWRCAHVLIARWGPNISTSSSAKSRNVLPAIVAKNGGGRDGTLNAARAVSDSSRGNLGTQFQRAHGFFEFLISIDRLCIANVRYFFFNYIYVLFVRDSFKYFNWFDNY